MLRSLSTTPSFSGFVERKKAYGRIVHWSSAQIGSSRFEVYEKALREVQQGHVLRLTRTDKVRDMRN